MKIGIITREIALLRDFELRIIEKILSDPNLELGFLINYKSQIKLVKTKLNLSQRSSIAFGALLLRLQLKLEKRFFKSKPLQNKEEILNQLHKIPIIEVNPIGNDFEEKLSPEDAEKINSYKIDVLLAQDFIDLRGEILESAKFGVWRFCYGDITLNNGGFLAFWEIVLKEPVIAVTLHKLTTYLEQDLIVYKGFYNRHWSVIKSRRNILDQSVAIFFKNISRLQNNELTEDKSLIRDNSIKKIPSTFYVIKYLMGFYTMVAKRIHEGLMTKVFGKRYHCWTLFIGQGNFMEAALTKLVPIKLPKDEFWADPFFYHYKNSDYIFFENYSYSQKKGKISCGRVDGNKLVDVVDVLKRDYHLSYPFIFEEEGSLYMIPESSGNNKVEILKCVKFPNEWGVYSTAFTGESIVDTTYYKDENNQRWLFLNKGYGKYRNSELYIYKIDSLKMNVIQEHQQNPVLIDSRIARSAGGIFKYRNQLIRPSQNNSNGTYGYGLNINEIEKLSLTEYKEKRLKSIAPNFKRNLVTVHHLSQGKSMFVIDGAFVSN